MCQLKWIMILAIGILALGFSPLSADSLGYIDIEKIFINYKESKKIQDNMQKKRDDYQKDVEQKQKKIEEAKKNNKNDEELKKLVEQIEKELRPKQEDILKQEAEIQRTLFDKIMGAVTKVRREYGIDVVMEKRVVYSGGFDLTDFVIEKLNK